MSIDARKRAAAQSAVAHVRSGMTIGLGTGSTAKHAIDIIGEQVARGDLRDINAVATSRASEARARALGIPIVPFQGRLDVAIDGIDELTPRLDAIKGLGGALTREKIVESRTDLLIFIADDSKKVAYLGEKAPLPVEVIPLAIEVVARELERLGAAVSGAHSRRRHAVCHRQSQLHPRLPLARVATARLSAHHHGIARGRRTRLIFGNGASGVFGDVETQGS